MESLEFIIAIFSLLIYIGVPLGVVGGILYFFNQRRHEKAEESLKDYSEY